MNALSRNTTGNYNTATGDGALYNNTTGLYNTANGFDGAPEQYRGRQQHRRRELARSRATPPATTIRQTVGTRSIATPPAASTWPTASTLSIAIPPAPQHGDRRRGGCWIWRPDQCYGHRAGAVVDASDKVRIGNSSVTVIEGQVAYTFTSDRNKKENFQPVDGEEVLRKIRQFDLTSWNYIGQDAKTLRHYGPMAQDFYAAFGHDAIGTVGTPKTINSGDMAGIMMIAIKTLATENVQLKSAVAKQEAVNAEQRKRLEALTARFEEQDKQIQTVSDELQSRKPIQSLARNIP